MDEADTLDIQLFQFHLVRLKGSGTASSSTWLRGFQFHLVRLKVFTTDSNITVTELFQFHLVRLKASVRAYYNI